MFETIGREGLRVKSWTEALLPNPFVDSVLTLMEARCELLAAQRSLAATRIRVSGGFIGPNGVFMKQAVARVLRALDRVWAAQGCRNA